jgi:hypothetical protein
MKLVRLNKACLNEANSKVHIGRHLSDTFPIQDILKQGHALLPLLSHFALGYVIRKIQEKQMRLYLIGTYQFLVYIDDTNILGDYIDTTVKNIETLTEASKEVGLEVNTEKAKYMLLSRRQNVGQNHNIKIVSRCFENAAQFRYLGTTSDNACCRSIQNICLLV